jgi:hypothetical protein
MVISDERLQNRTMAVFLLGEIATRLGPWIENDIVLAKSFGFLAKILMNIRSSADSKVRLFFTARWLILGRNTV